jgi:Rrf2 family iron-sulfur cluster assembly transcriptional regulator
MRFQKTTEYAIRVMFYLANHQEELYSANKLHQILHIPYKYLGQLMNKLTRAGLVEVVQGKYGGYRLHPNRQNIYLYEIIGVVEGLDNYERCVLGFENCSDENPCPLHQFWLKHREGIKDLIYNTQLRDLEKQHNMKL